jgi:hypothetical protein
MAKRSIDIDALVAEIGKRDNNTPLTKRTLENAVIAKSEELARVNKTSAAVEEGRIWTKIYSEPGFNPGLDWMKDNTVASYHPVRKQAPAITAAEREAAVRALEICKLDPTIPITKAYEQAWEQDGLYEQYEEEVRLSHGEDFGTVDVDKRARTKRRPTEDDDDSEEDDEDDDDLGDDSDRDDTDDDAGSDRIRDKRRKGVRVKVKAKHDYGPGDQDLIPGRAEKLAKALGRTLAREGGDGPMDDVIKATAVTCRHCATRVFKGENILHCSYCGGKL